ncbi:WAT1-related protein At1g68170-like [Corylus avellana]|uniref:WAT1-related protein At1g68170-like n=1 Tax=Corylus avellana TaxID=13451 RepID=UPI00286A5319|nr:WAT1-related protein At1g68170-like [Corylus avellana]
MEGICKAMHGVKAGMLMVVVQFAFAGVNVFYKLASNDGMSLRVVIAYRFIFGTVFVLPIALVFERKKRPKLSWVVLFQAFLCGLFGGSLAQNLYIESLYLTSVTFASALTNLIPAITFILAVLFGLEKLNVGTRVGKAKVLGTLIGIGGAMVLTFYKGAEIEIWSSHVNLLHHPQNQTHPKGSENHVLGCLLAVGSCSSFALWLIIQTKMSEKYPCQFSSTALMCVMGAIQAVVFALCMERDWSQWRLGWNIRLLTVSYTGVVGSGLMVTLIAWCVRMRGPLFVSVFNPLMLVLVAIMGSLLLDEKLHLGSILGAALIVCGLYVVLWGKGKEMKKNTQPEPPPSNTSPDSSELVDIAIHPPTELNVIVSATTTARPLHLSGSHDAPAKI